MRPERNPSYRSWIRLWPCLICGRKAQAAHQGPHGIGQKASDYTCVPLCYEHHSEQGRIGRKAFDAKYGIDLLAIGERLWERWNEANK